MTVQARGSATSASSSGSGATVTGTIPSTVQPGDLILAALHAAGAGAVLTVPAGWFEIAAVQAASSSTSSCRAAWRRAQPGDAGGSVSFGTGLNARWAITACAYFDDGGDTVSYAQATTSTSANTASPTSPPITPIAANLMAVALVGGTTATAGLQPTITAATGYTTQAQATSTSATLKNAVTSQAITQLTSTATTATAVHTLSTGQLAVASATLVLSNINVPPTANAGPDRVVSPGATITLSGAGSTDPDGTIAGYTWTQTGGPAITLSSSTSASPTFTAPSRAAGAVLEFRLTVTDERGAGSAPDLVTITVAPTAAARVRVAGAWQALSVRNRRSGAWL